MRIGKPTPAPTSPRAAAGFAPQFDPELCAARSSDIDVTEKIPVLWPQFMSLAAVPVLAIRGEHSDLLSPRDAGGDGGASPRLETADGARARPRAAAAGRADRLAASRVLPSAATAAG